MLTSWPDQTSWPDDQIIYWRNWDQETPGVQNKTRVRETCVLAGEMGEFGIERENKSRLLGESFVQ